MINYFAKGLLIGVIFGIPVGVVGVLTIKRSITYGAIAGLLSGIGCSVADLFYSCISIFSFTLIYNFILQYQNIIRFVGSILVIVMGIGIINKKQETTYKKADISKIISFFTSSFFIAITNPTTILSFLIAFSIFDIATILNKIQGIVLVVGIFCGTCIWWFVIAMVTQIFRKRITTIWLKYINYILGILVILLGIIMTIQTITKYNIIR